MRNLKTDNTDIRIAGTINGNFCEFPIAPETQQAIESAVLHLDGFGEIDCVTSVLQDSVRWAREATGLEDTDDPLLRLNYVATCEANRMVGYRATKSGSEQAPDDDTREAPQYSIWRDTVYDILHAIHHHVAALYRRDRNSPSNPLVEGREAGLDVREAALVQRAAELEAWAADLQKQSALLDERDEALSAREDSINATYASIRHHAGAVIDLANDCV